MTSRNVQQPGALHRDDPVNVRQVVGSSCARRQGNLWNVGYALPVVSGKNEKRYIMKNAIHLISSLFGKPLLLEAATLRTILDALNASVGFSSPQSAVYDGGRNSNIVPILSGVAVIPVLNILSYRPLNFWSYLFGGTTYQEIRGNFSQALGNSAVSAIVLDVASPGGTIEGLFDLVDDIYQARSVKPIYAMINESAFSAAYAIASAAEKVFIPRTGRAGSIGVGVVHIDASVAEAKAGLKFTEVCAGAGKINGTPHAPLTAKARAVYQGIVDQSYDLFVKTVARNRTLQPAHVRAQQAAIYTGKEAVSAGLADSVLSFDAAWKTVVGAKSKVAGKVTGSQRT